MAINEQKIIEGVHGLSFAGDDNGLIRRFGVLLNNTLADYFNDFSFGFEEAVIKSHGKEFAEIARSLLSHAAQDCAVNTFFGITLSDAWKGLIEPMIENEEDRIRGLVAVENALGWAKNELIELIPGEKLVLRSSGGYEETGFQQKYGTTDHGVCYMLNGVAAGFMDLVYGPGLGVENLATFEAKEVKCKAKGDEYCEFVVTRREE